MKHQNEIWYLKVNTVHQTCFIIDTLLYGANSEPPVVSVGVTSEGKEVYLRDIWPSREEVQQTEEDTVISSIFKDLRGRMEVRT